MIQGPKGDAKDHTVERNICSDTILPKKIRRGMQKKEFFFFIQSSCS